MLLLLLHLKVLSQTMQQTFFESYHRRTCSKPLDLMYLLRLLFQRQYGCCHIHSLSCFLLSVSADSAVQHALQHVVMSPLCDCALLCHRSCVLTLRSAWHGTWLLLLLAQSDRIAGNKSIAHTWAAL